MGQAYACGYLKRGEVSASPAQFPSNLYQAEHESQSSTQSLSAEMSDKNRPLCLLALDGGGVRGLSELLILREMMLRIQKRKNLAAPPKPCEQFDLICGTSTGGLIALMLGRLRMSVEQVIDEYCEFAEEVFGKPKKLPSEGRFEATTLKKVFQNIVRKYGNPQGQEGGADPDLKLLEGESSELCQVFVCTRNARAMNEVRLFRSYRSYNVGEYEEMAIWEAARATSAAPTFFKRLKIGPKAMQEEFLDGGIGSNNPTKILIEEVGRHFKSRVEIACIISLGTGKSRITEFKSPSQFQKTVPKDLIDALKEIATDCENVAKELDRKFSSRPGIYFRFNVEHGLEDVEMDEWKELGNIKAKTVAYLGEDKVDQAVDEAVATLFAKPPQIQVSELENPVKETCPRPKLVVPFGRRISHFIGRSNVLDEIHQKFNSADANGPRSVVIVLRAMGGQGKTQVALEYCQRAENEDYDYILWADAETRASLDLCFAEFARALPRLDLGKAALVTDIMSEEMSVLDRVRALLLGKKYLMVIDNLDVPSEHGDIKNYLMLGNVCHTLITSRHMDTERLGVSIALPGLSVQEGNDLLTRQSGREASDDDDARDRNRVVFALGGLALGLDQAALLIREKNLTYSQFLNEFQEFRVMLRDSHLPNFWEYEKMAPGDAQEPKLRRKIGVETTWTMSFEYLRSQSNGESTCHLLTLSAYLSSTGISEAAFTPYLQRAQQLLTDPKALLLDSSSENDIGIEIQDQLQIHTLIKARYWARPFFEETPPYKVRGAFSDAIRDAFKVGLVTSSKYHETHGTVYSMHPLVSRWLMDRDNGDCVAEALFVVYYLTRDRIVDTNLFNSEMIRHANACVELKKQPMLTPYLSTGVLRSIIGHFDTYVSLSFEYGVRDLLNSAIAAYNLTERGRIR